MRETGHKVYGSFDYESDDGKTVLGIFSDYNAAFEFKQQMVKNATLYHSPFRTFFIESNSWISSRVA